MSHVSPDSDPANEGWARGADVPHLEIASDVTRAIPETSGVSPPETSYSLAGVSWRAATDIRRLPTDDRLFERLDETAVRNHQRLLVASAAWAVLGSRRWDRPPSVAVLVTSEQLLIAQKAQRFGTRSEMRAWWCKELAIRGVRPVRGAESYIAVDLEHWIDGLIALVFRTRAECDVVSKLLAR
ncbi:MAG TPA: hypothetical protein VEJ87_14210 [Acidimicrobiales bacterium]|nr:hypothetical protein [Acidimicrobiales bacterium]